MGAWGTGIFDDDTAMDVRDYYLELLLDGIPEHEAAQMVLERFEDDANDDDYKVIFWTALAAIQWETGRLEEFVKDRTLNLLEEGDSPLWLEQEESVDERKAVLEGLKTKLNSPQPPKTGKKGLQALLDGIASDEEVE